MKKIKFLLSAFSFALTLGASLTAMAAETKLPESEQSIVEAKKNLEDTEYSHATRGLSLHVGAASLLGGAYTEHGASGAIGIAYAIGLKPAFLEVRFDTIFTLESENDTESYTSFSLGYNHYLWNIDPTTSLYLGASLGFGGGSSNLGSDAGFHVGSDLGLTFFRGSDVNFDLRLRVGTSSGKKDVGTQPAYLGLLAGIRF